MTTGPQTGGQDGDRLDSWKAIAAYIGKDVRTALRWAKDGGMPVYHHADRKRGAVYAYRSEIDKWIHADRPASTPFLKRPLVRRLAVILALALVAAGTAYWLRTAFDGEGLVAANPAWVLIADFDNRTGEERFDGTLETALRRELANSRHVLVVAPERVSDTLILMKQTPSVPIDTDLGREICLRLGGVRAILTGWVEKFDSRYLLSLAVIDPSDGRMVASAEEMAPGESEVLPALHSLGNWVRRNLGEELRQIEASDAELEKVTTPSLRALELYTQGIQILREDFWAQVKGIPEEKRSVTDAEALFREAVQVDPGFASAYLFIFWSLQYQGKMASDEALEALAQAMKFSHTTSDQERLFIESTYYRVVEVDIEKACSSSNTLAELFPDHFWAAGNSAFWCGSDLGKRADFTRYAALTVEQRPEWNTLTATALALLEHDFDRARPYYERARERRLDQYDVLVEWKVAYLELFPAEELLHLGMLPEVMSELQRVEGLMESLETRFRHPVIRKLALFYLSLGQFRKALELTEMLPSVWLPGIWPAWCAYLRGDQSAFEQHIETAYEDLEKVVPDPDWMALRQLRANLQLWNPSLPIEVLAPLYDPESVAEYVLQSDAPNLMPLTDHLTWPKLEARLQLVRGKKLLDEGRIRQALAALKSGTTWFRDNGDWETFSYYFLGAELRAEAYAAIGDLESAHLLLEEAAEQVNLVNSYTLPQHQKVRARLASLARELGRFEDARSLEAELVEELRLADPDHPILLQIGSYRDTAPAR
jgi:hypothetical protein